MERTLSPMYRGNPAFAKYERPYSGGYVGPAIPLAEYHSESSPGKKYYVVESTADGDWYCTCPGWISSKKTPKTCKHLKDYHANHGDPVLEEPE